MLFWICANYIFLIQKGFYYDQHTMAQIQISAKREKLKAVLCLSQTSGSLVRCIYLAALQNRT